MKKLIAFVLTLMLALAACTAVAEGGDTIVIPEAGRTLVVYYSATSNTERVADIIAAETGADVFALEPVNPYTSADLNWTDSKSRVCYEHEHPEAQQEVALKQVTPENWETYNTVYIGYPIWWGIAAWPVNQFVTGNDFTGKTVIPFCNSASSGLGESGTLLADMAGTGEWLAGRRFTAYEEEDEVLAWVRDMQQAASWQDIVLTFGEQQLHGVLYANETARLFAQMLPLNVELWNPAPGFAKAFNLPEAIPDMEPHTRAYELGGLAYWYPGHRWPFSTAIIWMRPLCPW